MNKQQAQIEYNDTRKMGVRIPEPMVKGLPENKHGVINQVVDVNVNNSGDTIDTIQGILTDTNTISFTSVPISPGPPSISADVNFQDTNTVDLGEDGSGLKATVKYQDSDSINLSDDGSGLKADVLIQTSDTVALSVDASGLKADAIYQMSITADANGLMLDGDEATPGNSQYYGTDSGGTKGFFDITAGTPGAPDTSIQFNNAGSFGGMKINVTQNDLTAVNWVTEAQTNTDADGIDFSFQGSLGKGTGTGGAIDIFAGWDEANIAFGGELFLGGSPTTGKPEDSLLIAAYPVDGDGGDLVLSGSTPNDTGTIAGVVKIANLSSGFFARLDTSLVITADQTFTFNDSTGGFVVADGNTTTTAPTLAGGAPLFTDYYGGNTNALGDPVAWIDINIAGTVYKVPLYQ